MELNNYRSVTPIKRKPRKITATATLVLCLIALIIGVLFGQAIGGDAEADIQEMIASGEVITKKEYESEITALQEAHKKQISDMQAAQAEQAEQQQAAIEESEASAAQLEEPVESVVDEESGGFWSTFLIILLIAVIGVCIFFAVKILKRRNDEEYDDDDYDDEDYDDEYEDDEEYDDEEYDEEEYEDDEEYDEEYDEEEYEDDEE